MNPMLKEEIWTDIEGYQGRYKVSNYGRVKHTKSNRIKVNTLSNSKLIVRLWCRKEHKNKSHSVHRLVAQHFIQSPGHKQIAFKTKNRYNPRVDNLYIKS